MLSSWSKVGLERLASDCDLTRVCDLGQVTQPLHLISVSKRLQQPLRFSGQ